MLFETERLRAGCWNDVNCDEVFAIYSDPEVTRWLNGPDATLAITKKRIADYERRHQHLQQSRPPGADGFVFGIWPVSFKPTGQYAGTMMMKPLPDAEGGATNDIEVGWHFGQPFWGQGLATEAARKLLEIGFESGIAQLHAVMLPENGASQKVAQRLGMTHVGQADAYYGVHVEHFKITKSDWAAAAER